MLFQLLLPLVAICFVLAILKININPTSPSIMLNFGDLLQQDPVIVAGAPSYLDPCRVDLGALPSEATCQGGLHFRCAMSLYWHLTWWLNDSSFVTEQHASASMLCALCIHSVMSLKWKENGAALV